MPAFPGKGSALMRYAQRFNGVEINSTFYRSSRSSTYARWRDSVPAGFQFSVKVPRVISHDKRLVDVEREFTAFLTETAALGTSRGPLLLQLPPSMAFDAAIAAGFFGMVRALFEGQMVVEPRHVSWFVEECDRLLQAHQIARAAADPARSDEGLLPGGFRDLTYLRLHGAPRVYFSSYDVAKLEMVRAVLETSRGARWCIFDNTASGAATANALDLQSELSG